MNRFESPALGSVPGARGRAVVLHLSVMVMASGLTASVWLGAAAESSRHQNHASPAATDTRVHITLPTVVVTAHRERPQELRSQVVAGASPDRANALADQPPRRLSR